MSTIKELLEKEGIDLKRITTTGKTTCPKCSADRKKPKDPCLSVNVIEGSYKCHNCSWAGRVFERPVYEKKSYIKPVFNNRTDLSKKMVDWFANRAISQQTLIDLKVGEAPEWMPQVFSAKMDALLSQGLSKEAAKVEANKLAVVNTIQFNYFRNGELINVKYRDGKKNFKLAKDAELIFYNLDSIKDVKECIICEGEPDAMAWHETGFKAVVSVPNGASKGKDGNGIKLEYLDNCIEHFNSVEIIYISSDDDEPGRALRDELARRLNIVRCRMLNFEGCKDANEYLVAYGPERLRQRIAEAKEFPIVGVVKIEEIWDNVMDVWENGLPEGDKTSNPLIDAHIRFMPGELTMVTGVPGHGKSVFLEEVSLKLCINAGWKFGVFSPESFPLYLYILRLIKKVVGCPADKNHISREDMGRLREWLMDHFYIIYPEKEGFLLDVLLQKARQLVAMKGINGLILDPWNRIEKSKPPGMDESSFIATQLVAISTFNQLNGVHTFLVAHPTKMLKEKSDEGSMLYQVPNLYSISGSAHFFNITQNGLCVYKNEDTSETEIHIQKIKWEHLGKKGKIVFRYVPYNTRLAGILETNTEIEKGYRDEDYASWLPEVAKPLNNKPMVSASPTESNSVFLRFNYPDRSTETDPRNKIKVDHDSADEEPPF